LSTGAPSQIPLGELTVLPRPSSWILGGLILRECRRRDWRGRKERGEEGRGKEKGKREEGEGRGECSHCSDFTI